MGQEEDKTVERIEELTKLRMDRLGRFEADNLDILKEVIADTINGLELLYLIVSEVSELEEPAQNTDNEVFIPITKEK